MTDEEALVILKENRPSRPYKKKGKELQAAIDQITYSYEMDDRIDRSKAWGSLGHQLDGDKIVFAMAYSTSLRRKAGASILCYAENLNMR